MKILHLYSFMFFLSVIGLIRTDDPITLEKDIMQAIKQLALNAMEKTEPTELTTECKKKFSETLIQNTAYLIKFFRDSAHTLNDLGSYHNCLSSVYFYDENQFKSPPLPSSTTQYNPFQLQSISEETTPLKKSTYIILDDLVYVLFAGEDILKQNKIILYGACLPKECTPKDYGIFFKNFFLGLGIQDLNDIDTINSHPLGKEHILTNTFWYGLPAVVFFAILMIFSCIPKLPVQLFKCCFRKKQLNEHRSSDSLTEDESRLTSISTKLLNKYNAYKISKFKACFKLKENLYELNTSDITLHESRINNDSGFSVIKGIRGILLILYLISNTFKALHQYHLKDSEEIYFNTAFNSVLFFFLRFSFGALLSLSAFTMTYKLLYYLDKEIDYLEIVDDSKNHHDGSSIDNPLLPSEDNDTDNGHKNTPMEEITSADIFESNEKYREQLSFIAIIKFIMRQFYKYLLFILVLIIGRYAYYDVIVFSFNRGAIWELMKLEFIDKATIVHLLGHIFLFFPYIPNKSFYANPFGMTIIEISNFIIGSLIIFFCFKKNFRLDLIIFWFFIFILVAKTIFGITVFFKFNSKYLLQRFYPAKDFTQKEWNYVRNNQIYNGDTFAIGIFFGLVNYSIQKNPSISQRLFVWPNKLVIYLQKSQKTKVIIFTILFIILFIWNCQSYRILFKIYEMFQKEQSLLQNEIKDFSEKYLTSFYYQFDIDVFLIVFYITIISWLLLGENSMSTFLQNDNWNFISRPYFSFILIICGLIYSVLHQSDNKIKVSPSYITFYSLINSMFGFILCAFAYVFFELPLKKLNKFIIKDSKKDKSRRSDI